MYDCIVIGAGPSGMMAAATASKFNKRIAIIDQNPQLGRKMRLSGGGRCNITNNKGIQEFINHLPNKNGRFLYHALYTFGPKQIMDYFTNRGVSLKIEDHDRVFPESNRALDFIMALERELKTNQVEIVLETSVDELIYSDDIIRVKTNRGTYKGKAVVIATGGQSYPHTGSTGFGYFWAQKQGIQVTPLYPTETPILSSTSWIKDKTLQGLSFRDIILRLKHQTKVIKEQRHDLIITHFGLSGPAALMLSQFVYHHLEKHDEATIEIDFYPDMTHDELRYQLISLKKSQQQKTVGNTLDTFGPKRLVHFILEKNHIPQQLTMANIRNQHIQSFIEDLKQLTIIAHGVKPIQNAFVTGGGIAIKEINPKTMECKKLPGIYFVGEVLDLHGYTGGYNITIALSTGYVAGSAIGLQA